MGLNARLKRIQGNLRYGIRSRAGKCFICDKRSLFVCGSDNLKESLRCIYCGGISRSRMIASALCEIFHAKSLGRLPSELAIYETQATGPIHQVLKHMENYSCSEYFEDTPSGEVKNGIRSENIESLSFENGSFDVVIHQSVLEHVRHPLKALQECHRVLRSSGHLIFEVPMCDYWSPFIRGKSHPRIDVSGNNDVEILPPFYHKDPLRPEGILVYTDFGLDVGNELTSMGFEINWLIERFNRSRMSHSVVAVCKRNS